MDQNAVLGMSLSCVALRCHLLTVLLGFAGLVTAVAAWSIWGGDMFPAGQDPVGGENGPFFLTYFVAKKPYIRS